MSNITCKCAISPVYEQLLQLISKFLVYMHKSLDNEHLDCILSLNEQIYLQKSLFVCK